MPGQHFATILAQNDPFDVAQGLERYIRSLAGAQVREIITGARARLSEGYRAEFLPLLDEPDDERLKFAFAHALKSNLRAIPLFGPGFCEGVIAQIPADRAVGLGEEICGWPNMRAVAMAVVAIGLLLGGATVQRLVNAAEATARTPVVLVTPQPAIPMPVATQTPRRVVPPKRTAPRVAAVVKRATPAPAQAPPPTPVPHVRPVPAPMLPAGRGVGTIVAHDTPAPSPTPADVDVSDMPQSYSDATPLPTSEPPPSAKVSTPLAVPTPTPGPNRSWAHRLVRGATHLINRIDPFKSKPHPSPSPLGPKPL